MRSRRRARAQGAGASGILDDSGRFLWLDEHAARIFGGRSVDLIGSSSPFIPSIKSREMWWLDESSAENESLICHLRGMDDSRWALEIASHVGSVSGRETIRDYAAAALESVQEPDRDGMARNLTDIFTQWSGIPGSMLVVIDPETEEPRFAGGANHRRDHLVAMQECRRLGAPMVIWNAFTEGRIVVQRQWTRNVHSDPRLAPLRPFIDEAYAATAAEDALVGIPLQAFGRPRGVITGMVGDIESIDAERVALWLELGFHTALALEYREAIESARVGGEVHERARLNQELHDTVSQDLFALSLLAAGVEGDLHSAGPDDIQAEIRELRNVVESTSADVRALIGQRRRASNGMGLEERLSLLTDRLSVQTGIDLRASVTGDWRDLSPEFVDDAVHIVQEALRNIVKHAHARRASVRVSADPADSDAMLIEIVDDGMGFDPAAAGASSFGLATIRERAAGHGGSVEITTVPSTTLQVRMPAAYASEWDAARRP